MSFSSAKKDAAFRFSEDRPELFTPIDRNELSESALFLLDCYRVENANHPMAIFVSMVDKMSANQREVISRFEAAIALAGVEFGRIDLAIEKAEQNLRQVKILMAAVDQIQKDFALTTNKIRQRTNSDIAFNHLKPCLYGLFGAILTLIVLFISLRLKIL
jgi:hypothetical protein